MPVAVPARRLSLVVALAALAACVDSPTGVPVAPPDGPAALAITGQTGAVTRLASAPASLVAGVLQSNTTVYLFDEAGPLHLPAALTVDIGDPGSYTQTNVWPAVGTSARVLPAGTAVRSHYVHMDVNSVTALIRKGTITFDADIVGVILTDEGLSATDGLLGAPGTVYPDSLRRTVSGENADKIVISADRRTLEFTMALSDPHLDEFRVLTAAHIPDTTAPTVEFTGNQGTYGMGDAVAITCTVTDDAWGEGVDPDATTCPSVSAPAYTFGPGTTTLTATATDLAGNSVTVSTSFTVTATADDLCTLTRQFVEQRGIANAMCVKLQHRQWTPYIAHVRAQTNKVLTPQEAAILESFAQALRHG